MKPSTKVLSILSLSAAIGAIMSKSQADDKTENELDMIHWRGKKLYEAGFNATRRYPFPQLTDSKIRQVENKVNEICKHEQDFNIVEMLAFLIAGLTDIRAHMKHEKWVYLDPVLTRASWALELFDSKYEMEEAHVQALERFERWAA